MADKLKVLVLFGGRSGEHEVSLESARSVISAMDPSQYQVIPVGICKNGDWVLPDNPQEALSKGLEGTKSKPVTLSVNPSKPGIIFLDEKVTLPVDVVFPVLHGPNGEDGTVQGLLELSRLPYVGAGVLGSSIGMDKIIMKTVFRDGKIPSPDYILVRKVEWESNPSAILTAIEDKFSYPIFIKPANLGSSVGISKVHNREEIGKAIDLAGQYDRRIIVEEGMENCREIEVAVLGNDFPKPSIPGEIVPANEFYDYDAKYLDENSRLLIPAPLPEEDEKAIREMAVRVFVMLDCAGLGRVDFFYRNSDRKIWVSEINTIPGFTKISMYPKLWEATGISYSKLIDELIKLALERHSR